MDIPNFLAVAFITILLVLFIYSLALLCTIAINKIRDFCKNEIVDSDIESVEWQQDLPTVE